MLWQAVSVNGCVCGTLLLALGLLVCGTEAVLVSSAAVGTDDDMARTSAMVKGRRLVASGRVRC